MSLALAALVVVLGQTGGAGKVQVIKGKKNASAQKQSKAPVDAPELAPQPIIDKSKPPNDGKPTALNEKANGGDQDAQPNKEQSAEDKAKADKLKAQQKQLEKISADNQKMWQQSADALAGDTNN
ncbi:MAG: hypothetical protein JNM17_34170 [Archangium sp.]|nr:hypothetical protein [Archangium sp.]